MTDYGLKACRIESEFNELDGTVDKEAWLKQKLNELDKEWLHDLDLIEHNFNVAYNELVKLLKKEDK